MNRSAYYDYIDKHLHINAYRIITNGKLNMLNLHMHSENFYLHFFNLIYDYELENCNTTLQNVEAIDLIDHKNTVVFQVSSTSTKQKIESALIKEICKDYCTYNFKFISIAKEASNLRTYTYNNPHSIIFLPANDIYDIVSILSQILSFSIDKQKLIYEFIKKELGGEIDIVKLDSNLATVINILANEKWDDANKIESVNKFEIERKITYNQLNESRSIIEEYSLFYEKVDSKYSEFDSQGSNKSNSVLAGMKREYSKLINKESPDEVFKTVIANTIKKVIESPNFKMIPIDELELCVDILVVDAFIRCKIFENPKDYNYVAS